MFPTAPKTEVTAKGNIVYSKVVCENVRKLEAYVEEMASGDTISGSFNIQKVQDDVLKLWSVVKSQSGISQEQKNRIKAVCEGVVQSLRKDLDPRSVSEPEVGVPFLTPANFRCHVCLCWSQSSLISPQSDLFAYI